MKKETAKGESCGIYLDLDVTERESPLKKKPKPKIKCFLYRKKKPIRL